MRQLLLGLDIWHENYIEGRSAAAIQSDILAVAGSGGQRA